MKSFLKALLILFFSFLAIAARGDSFVVDEPDKIYRLDSPKTLFTFIPNDDPINKSPNAIQNEVKTAEVTLWDRWSMIPGLKKTTGLGWYRKNLQIHHPAAYALLLPKTFRGVQVYLNGILIGQTRSFNNNFTPQTLGRPTIIPVPANIVHKGENLLAFRTGELDGFSSFSYGVYFGSYSKVEEKHQQQIIWNSAIALVVIVFSLFFLIFYVYRKSEKFNLYFAIFSFLIGLWIFGYTGYGLYLADHYIFYLIFTYCGGILSNIFYLSFIQSFLTIKETKFSQLLKFFFVLMLAAAIFEFVLTSSIRYFNIYLHDLYSLGIIVVIVYSLILNYFAIRNRRQYALRLLFAQTMIEIPTILVILNVTININVPLLMKEGYFLLVVSLSSVLASRYAQVHTDLEHAHGELLVLDKMKDDFMATTSHELRTPLHGIIGLSETLLANKKDPLTQHQSETIGIIHQSALRLSHLVNDILDFSRLRGRRVDLMPSRVTLGETLRGLVSLARGMVQDKAVELRCDISENLPDIVADRHRLEQIVMNLLGNAVKFTEQGSVVLTAHGKDGGVLIEVCDTGCGIPADKVGQIWNPYEQADQADTRRYGGSGLGLAITKHLVEMHGGTIEVESTPGKGTVFTLWLPLAPPQDTMGIANTMPVFEVKQSELQITAKESDGASAAVPDGRVPKAMRKDDIRILAVDDDPVNLKVAVEALSMEGYLVATAASGPEALAAIEEEPPHCILLDIMLPGMSGYEVAATIRSSHNDGYLPIIMVTARGQAEDLTKGFLYGASDYITKPFNIRELLIRVENQLVIRNIVDMEKKVKSHLLVERDRIESNLLERSALLHEAVHKLTDWERIISEDLNIAKRFLGKLMTTRVTAKEVEYALHFDPLHTIGGDVYDINEYTPGKLRIFMADATGHGINASLNTITIMTEYDLIRGELIPPADILGSLNDRFCKKLAQYRILFTCCIAEIDLFAGTIRFSSAGHPDQFLFSAGGECIPLKPKGPIIGFRKGIGFEEHLFEFLPESMLFCYTDGLLEDDIPTRSEGRVNTRTLRDEEYLRNVLLEHYNRMSAEELCKKVKTVMKGERYRKERLSDDDITMIAVRRR